MPVVDITNPLVINFYIENYEKENRLRLNWIRKHREKVNAAVTLNRKPTCYTSKDIIAYSMHEGMATITRDHVAARNNRRKIALRDGINVYRAKDIKDDISIVKVGLGSSEDDPKLALPKTDLSTDPVMRPVDEKVSQVLYKSKPGRKIYLAKRSKINPEDKYYFPECSYWDYGWRLKDCELHQTPTYGKCCHLTKDTLKNRSGPQPDPAHYNSPAVASVLLKFKCAM